MILCNVHNGPPLVSILSQLNLIHSLPCCLFKFQFNIIFLSMFMSKKPGCVLFWVFSYQNFVCISLLHDACHKIQTYALRLDHSNNIWRGKHIMKLLIKQTHSISKHQIARITLVAGRQDWAWEQSNVQTDTILRPTHRQSFHKLVSCSLFILWPSATGVHALYESG